MREAAFCSLWDVRVLRASVTRARGSKVLPTYAVELHDDVVPRRRNVTLVSSRPTGIMIVDGGYDDSLILD
jgi:hypothetical protein